MVEELEYQLKIAKAIEIMEIESYTRVCSYFDLRDELIILGSNYSGYTLDNLKHFKELYTIVYDKKIVNKEWLKIFKALKVYCSIDTDKYWDLKRSIEREVYKAQELLGNDLCNEPRDEWQLSAEAGSC